MKRFPGASIFVREIITPFNEGTSLREKGRKDIMSKKNWAVYRNGVHVMTIKNVSHTQAAATMTAVIQDVYHITDERKIKEFKLIEDETLV
jgi:hypothetical protein